MQITLFLLNYQLWVDSNGSDKFLCSTTCEIWENFNLIPLYSVNAKSASGFDYREDVERGI